MYHLELSSIQGFGGLAPFTNLESALAQFPKCRYQNKKVSDILLTFFAHSQDLRS